jgi:hypothetical protein
VDKDRKISLLNAELNVAKNENEMLKKRLRKALIMKKAFFWVIVIFAVCISCAFFLDTLAHNIRLFLGV